MVLILLFVGLSPVFAKNYYVATNGSNSNPGTQNQPFKTIQKAANVVNPGDVVFIKRGIYRDKIEVRRSGSSGKVIKFTAFPGDELKAIIEGQTFSVFKSSHIEISNLRIQKVPKKNGLTQGIYVEGPARNIVIKNNHTFDTWGSGISVWGVGYKKPPGKYENYIGVKVLNNKVEKACNGGWNECITLSNGIVNFEIKNNEIFNGGDPINGGEGIDVKVGAKNGIIASNYMHDLTRRGLYLDANGDDSSNKPIIKNIKVYNNIAHNNVGHGMAIMTEGVGDVFDIDIYNNLFYKNTDDGFMIYKHPKGSGVIRDIRVYNNTMIDNKRYGFLLAHPTSFNIKVFNNILYNNKDNGSSRPQFEKDYRISEGSATQNNNIIAKDPKFVNAGARNYKLTKNSPAVDAGTSNGAPSKDIEGNNRTGQIDIGAYEFIGNGNPNPTPQIIPNGIYNIVSNVTGQNLIAPSWNNHEVRMYDSGNFTDQQWNFEHKGNNLYTIKNVGTQRYLRVVANKCTNGAKTHTAANVQQWKIEKNGNGIYAIKPSYCLNKALDVDSGQVNADVILWQFNPNNSNQKWKLNSINKSRVAGNIAKVLYPNPVKNNMHVKGVSEGDIITVYDIYGKEVMRKEVQNTGLEVINAGSLDTGVYYILSIDGKQKIRFIKK